MLKKKIIFGAAVILLLLISVLFVNRENYFNKVDDINMNATIDMDYAYYIKEGLNYKMKGDSGDVESYNEAIKMFKVAAEISENKYWIPYLNLSNTYRGMGKFLEAEEAVDKALEISNRSEISVYQSKIDLWQVNPAKSSDEIKELYKEAISNVLGNVNLIKSYAGYLRGIGDKKEAIKQFQILSNKFPENNAYKEEIETLQK